MKKKLKCLDLKYKDSIISLEEGRLLKKLIKLIKAQTSFIRNIGSLCWKIKCWLKLINVIELYQCLTIKILIIKHVKPQGVISYSYKFQIQKIKLKIFINVTLGSKRNTKKKKTLKSLYRSLLKWRKDHEVKKPHANDDIRNIGIWLCRHNTSVKIFIFRVLYFTKSFYSFTLLIQIYLTFLKPF